MFGEDKIASSQSLAHPRTADPDAVQLDRAGGLDTEALALPRLGQKSKVTGTVAAETKVIANFQMAYIQAVDQHFLHELGSGQLAQAPVEAQAQHQVDAFGSEQGELVAQAGQARRGGIRGKKLARLRLENQHATGHTEFGGTLTQTRQDGLMTTMDAVEITDGGDTAPMLGPQVV